MNIMSHELSCTSIPTSIFKVHEFVDLALSYINPTRESQSDVHIIADEMASNIEKHAYGGNPGTYLVRIGMINGRLEIEFEDSGKEFDPTRIDEAPVQGRHDRPAGNLGLLLVKGLADSVRYLRTEGKNVTTVVMRVQSNDIQKVVG